MFDCVNPSADPAAQYSAASAVVDAADALLVGEELQFAHAVNGVLRISPLSGNGGTDGDGGRNGGCQHGIRGGSVG